MFLGGIFIKTRLRKKIEEKREELNNHSLNEKSQELLQLSQELDELILKYTQKKLKKS